MCWAIVVCNMSADFLFLTSCSTGRIESRVMDRLYQAVSGRISAVQAKQGDIRSIRDVVRFLGLIVCCRTLVVHSPLVLSFPAILLARLLGKRLVALIWDVYPVRIAGQRYDRRLRRHVSDMVENLALRLLHKVFVPSADFLRVPTLVQAEVLNFWPVLSVRQPNRRRRGNEISELRVIFTGQINATRGLAESLEYLERIAALPIRLIIASGDPYPKELENHCTVEYLGFLPSENLRRLFDECDFGLICLSSSFGGPGFPSKVMEYVSAGLPALYFGPPLPAYVKMLELSGVGVDVKNLIRLDNNSSVLMAEDFSSKQAKFQRLACLTEEAVDTFCAICEGLLSSRRKYGLRDT